MLVQMQSMNWQQMALFFPGMTQPAPYFYAAPRAILDETGAQRLLRAAFCRAILDAAHPKDTLDRSEARAFLLEDGAAWAQLAGLYVTKGMIEEWAARDWPAAAWKRGHAETKRDIEKAVG